MCPHGTQVLVDGKCVPATVCKRPLVMIPGVGCRPVQCRQGSPVDGKCEKAIVCERPLVPNADNTDCVCPDHEVLRNGKCVKVEKPKPSKTCKRGFHWNGDMCVKNKTEPKDETPRKRQRLDLPNLPRGGSGGGFPGGSGSGGSGGGTPGKR